MEYALSNSLLWGQPEHHSDEELWEPTHSRSPRIIYSGARELGINISLFHFHWLKPVSRGIMCRRPQARCRGPWQSVKASKGRSKNKIQMFYACFHLFIWLFRLWHAIHWTEIKWVQVWRFDEWALLLPFETVGAIQRRMFSQALRCQRIWS